MIGDLMKSVLFPDIAIVVALVFVAVLVVLLSRIGLLPKKSIPYVASALLAVLGFAVFRRWKEQNLRRALEERRKGLQAREKQAEAALARFEHSDQLRREWQAETRRQEESFQKHLLMLRENEAAKRREVENLSGDEVFRRFREVFGG